MNHIPSGRYSPPHGHTIFLRFVAVKHWCIYQVRATGRTGEKCATRSCENLKSSPVSPFPQVSLVSRAIPLCMAAAFGLFKFVDKLFELIKFIRLDVLKRHPELVSSNPLYARIFD
jgi:hypothetical protein